MYGRLTLLYKILIRNRFNTNTDDCKWNCQIYKFTANHINVIADESRKDPKSVTIPMVVIYSNLVAVRVILKHFQDKLRFASITSSAVLSALNFCPNISLYVLIQVFYGFVLLQTFKRVWRRKCIGCILRNKSEVCKSGDLGGHWIGSLRPFHLHTGNA